MVTSNDINNNFDPDDFPPRARVEVNDSTITIVIDTGPLANRDFCVPERGTLVCVIASDGGHYRYAADGVSLAFKTNNNEGEAVMTTGKDMDELAARLAVLDFFEDFQLVQIPRDHDGTARGGCVEFEFQDYLSLVCGHDHDLDELAQTLRDPAFKLSELPPDCCSHWHQADLRLLRAAVECALLSIYPTDAPSEADLADLPAWLAREQQIAAATVH